MDELWFERMCKALELDPSKTDCNDMLSEVKRRKRDFIKKEYALRQIEMLTPDYDKPESDDWHFLWFIGNYARVGLEVTP